MLSALKQIASRRPACLHQAAVQVTSASKQTYSTSFTRRARILSLLLPQTGQTRTSTAINQKSMVGSNPGCSSIVVRHYSNTVADLKKTKLVIFDKDGTFVYYGSGWTNHSMTVIKEIEDLLKIEGIGERILKLWGYNSVEEKWYDGLMCEPPSVIMQDMYTFFLSEGLSEEKAKDFSTRERYYVTENHDAVEGIDNPSSIFRQLRSHGIKIGVCTTDSRGSTLQMLKNVGVTDLVDYLVCGDDPDSKPKPDPVNIRLICSNVGVAAEEAVMVGDTTRDIEMGQAAGVLATIGVASGVGTKEELAMADLYLPSIKHVLELVTAK